MEPLKQWICDVCGKIIERPEDGYVVWGYDEDGRIDKIRILHQNRRGDQERQGCDHDRFQFPNSLPIDRFLGDDGKILLLSLVDPGPFFREEYRDQIADKRQFLDVVRRFQIPYYEEARLYLDRARAEGFLDGANEIYTYLPSTLKSVVEEYGSKE